MRGADRRSELRRALLESEREVPTSRLGRLWRTGRSAVGMAASVLSGSLRGGDADGAISEEALRVLLSRLGELKGAAMKAGQILSYVDVTLPEELRETLALLQTTAPKSPFPAIEAQLRASLGERAAALLEGLAREPVAVASIGQVHRGRLPDGTEVAVKVRHPGIEAALVSDFSTAGGGAAFASTLFPGSRESVASFVEEARQTFLEECDFSLEAERQRRFAMLFDGDPAVRIPEVHDRWSAREVLTTSWSPGRSLDEWLAQRPSQAERDRIGLALFSFYVRTLYRHGWFHADPHPGNYAIADDGALIVYDFGCVRRFEPAFVAALARLLAAVRADDETAIRGAFAELGATPPSRPDERAHLRTLLRGFFAPLLVSGTRPMEAGAGLEMRTAIRDKRALLKLNLPGQLLFLFRLRFGLYAVLARTGARLDWAALEGSWAREAGKLRGDDILREEGITADG